MSLKAPSFLADAMLGSVARKLRIFGFDTLYIADAHDNEILKMAIEQDRIVLTSDKELFRRVVKAGIRGVLVGGGGELEDLAHILSKNGISSLDLSGIGSRCSVCNGLLEDKKPAQVKNGLPRKISQLHMEFYQCKDCSKVYWDGSHLRRIRALAKNLDSKLAKVATT